MARKSDSDSKVIQEAEGVVYATLQELQSEKPTEDNLKIGDQWYRVRGMARWQVNDIIKRCHPYNDMPALALALDEVLTVIYGLVKPSLDASTPEQVEASVLMVEQWPTSKTQAIANRIRELTWPQYVEEPLEDNTE